MAIKYQPQVVYAPLVDINVTGPYMLAQTVTGPHCKSEFHYKLSVNAIFH